MKEFIFEENNRPTPACHASTVLPLRNGSVFAAWFGGSAEGKDDVDVWVAKREGGRWKEAQRISANANVPHWNPVLFLKEDGGVVLYFKVGKKIDSWQTFFCLSKDSGGSWSEPEILVPGDTSGGRGPVKNKNLRLSNGDVLAPASSEQNKSWLPFVDISRDDGLSWERTKNIESKALLKKFVPAIQPTLWESGGGNVHMLLRTSEGKIFRSDSKDFGKTWGRMFATELPNNNSGIDVVKTANGSLCLVMNPVGKNWGERTPLSLLVSADNGMVWEELLCLENVQGEFSYPAIEAVENRLFITYTYKREQIAYWEIEL